MPRFSGEPIGISYDTSALPAQPITVQPIKPRFSGIPVSLPPPPIKFTDFVDDVWEGISGIPLGFGSALSAALEGGDPEDISKNKDLTDGIIERNRARSRATYDMLGADSAYIDKYGIKITRQNVQDIGTNIGFSATSILGGFIAGITTAPIPVPGSSTAATFGAGALLGQRMDANAFLRDMRDGIDKEALSQIGRPLTDDEFVKFINNPSLSQAAKDMGIQWASSSGGKRETLIHSLHEAGWEGVGTVIAVNAGKALFRYAKSGGILGQVLSVVGGAVGEVLTEVPTQTGQQGAEVRAGLRPGEMERSFAKGEDWQKSFEEVAGPTLLTVGATNVSVYGAGKLSGALQGKLTI